MSFQFPIELEREEDGRWIAAIPSMPGVLTYGASETEAMAAVEALALRAIADRLEHGEIDARQLSVVFTPAA